MRAASSRISWLSWLLAAALLLSVGLNVYGYLAPRPASAPGWTVDDDDDDWDDDDNELAPSRATLADELRRTRQQLSRCQHGPTADAEPALPPRPRPHS